MGFNHNCIKDAKDLEYIEIGMYGKQRKIKCKICGSVWLEEPKEDSA